MAIILPKHLHPDFIKPDKAPTCAVDIDWNNPITKELKAFWVFTQVNGARDIVAGYSPTNVIGTEPEIVHKYGRTGLGCDGSGYLQYGDILDLEDAFTIITSVYDDATNEPDGHICGKVSATFNYICSINGGTEQVQMGVETGVTVSYPSSSAPGGLDFMNNKWNPLVFKYDGAASTIFTEDGQNTNSGPVTLTPNSDIFAIGDRGNTNNTLENTVIEYLAVFGRQLSESEHNSFTRSPYQILKPKADLIFFPVVSAGGVTGTSAVTLENSTSVASGIVESAAVTGTVAVTLENSTSNSSGALTVSGTASVTLENSTSNSTGNVATATITGTASVTLENSLSVASGIVSALPISGTISVTLENSISNSIGFIPVSGIINVILENSISESFGTGPIWSVKADVATTWTQQTDSSEIWTEQ